MGPWEIPGAETLYFRINIASKANSKREVGPFCLSNIAQYGLILKLIRGEAKHVLKFHSYPASTDNILSSETFIASQI